MATKDNVLLSSDPVFKDVLLEMLEGCRDLREATARMSETVLNALMSMQADEACGAPWGERSEERVNSRNGYRERGPSTDTVNVFFTNRDCGGDPGPRKGYTEDRMYSTEQRRLAIETFIRFDHSYADTIAELGYPTRRSLRAWYKDYLEHGEVRPPKRQREPKFTLEMRQAAVDYYLAHGKSLAGTMRRMGYPASREYLCGWIDELAPGQRKYRGPSPKAGPVPLAEKMQAVAELESRSGTAAEVAEEHGVSRTAPYVWRREMMGDDVGDTEEKGVPVSREYDDLPDDIEVLQDMLREAKMQLRRVQLELDVRQATLEIVKKTRAPTQNC